MHSSKLEDVETGEMLDVLKKRCSVLHTSRKQMLLLGAPGSGKGTQSMWLKEELGLLHLSTGDMLRSAIAEGTEIGKAAESIVKLGGLVPDEMVLDIIKQRFVLIAKKPDFCGFILDGFPRTVRQAEGLTRILQEVGLGDLTAVFYFAMDDDLLVQRVCGRRIHVPSGRTYHVLFKPPKVPERDDITGEPLTHRPDDNEVSFINRLKLYKQTTAPLVNYYQARGLLFRIDAAQPQEVVRRDMEMLFLLGGDGLQVPNKHTLPQTALATTTSS